MCRAALAGEVVGGTVGAQTHHALTLHCMLQWLEALLVGAAACMPSCRCPDPQRVPCVKHPAGGMGAVVVFAFATCNALGRLVF